MGGFRGPRRPTPGGRHDPTHVLSRRKLDAEKIQRSRRDEALEEGLLAAPEWHDRALEAHLARAHRHERLGLGARHLGALLMPGPLPPCREDEIAVARLEADEMVPVGAGGKVALDDAAYHTLFLSDQASRRGCNEELALGHVEVLLCRVWAASAGECFAGAAFLWHSRQEGGPMAPETWAVGSVPALIVRSCLDKWMGRPLNDLLTKPPLNDPLTLSQRADSRIAVACPLQPASLR